MDESNVTTLPTQQRDNSVSTREGNRIKTKALTGLLSTFRATLGKIDLNGVMAGYAVALQGIDPAIVEMACERWIKGIAGDEWNYAFPPSPPQLAIICRRIATELRPVSIGERTYGWTAPCSEILNGCITAAEAKRLVDEGEYPRGSIWCPGSLTSSDMDAGMLYAPDPRWRPPAKDDRPWQKDGDDA